MKLLLRRWLNVFRAALQPGRATCLRCGVPWSEHGHHDTYYRMGSACFPLCERCWQELETGQARLPYYRRLFERWVTTLDDPRVRKTLSPGELDDWRADTLSKWTDIEAAVLRGE